MPIKINQYREPFSPESFKYPSLVAKSDASRLLSRELVHYRDGYIRGRSFLLSGHRGSGKTTTVLQALLEVNRESHDMQLPTSGTETTVRAR